MTKAWSLWSWGGGGLAGSLYRGVDCKRLIQTPMFAQHFHGAKIITAAGGSLHSVVVTECGELYFAGKGQSCAIRLYASHTGLGHADMLDKLVPMLVSAHHMKGARVGRCDHGLSPQHALACL